MKEKLINGYENHMLENYFWYNFNPISLISITMKELLNSNGEVTFKYVYKVKVYNLR